MLSVTEDAGVSKASQRLPFVLAPQDVRAILEEEYSFCLPDAAKPLHLLGKSEIVDGQHYPSVVPNARLEVLEIDAAISPDIVEVNF
jgi:hypothetical protein